MDLQSFLLSLRHLDREAICAIAVELDNQAASVAGEVSWWKATIEVDRRLRARRVGLMGARAAHQAAEAVLATAADLGIELPDHAVTVVARAASEGARGLLVDISTAADVFLHCNQLTAA